MNFRSNDPTYDGIGMSRGSKDELLVWELFGEDQNSFIKSATLIRAAIEDDNLKNVSEDHDDDAWEHQEGSVSTAYHKR